MGFPNDKDIEKILNEIEKVDPTLVIDYSTASKSDVLKYQLCQEFVKVLKEEQISQAELARRLGVDRSIVNKIVLHKIDNFTVDRLMDLFSSIKTLEVFLKAV